MASRFPSQSLRHFLLCFVDLKEWNLEKNCFFFFLLCSQNNLQTWHLTSKSLLQLMILQLLNLTLQLMPQLNAVELVHDATAPKMSHGIF
jgi:hypothetical protein